MTELQHTDDEILAELAEYDDRRLLLWQLAADGRDFCGVQFSADEAGLQDAPLTEQVAAFVDDLRGDTTRGIRPEYDEQTDWDVLEEKYGDRADEYLPRQPDSLEIGSTEYDCGHCGYSFLDRVFWKDHDWVACAWCGRSDHPDEYEPGEWYELRYLD